MNNEFAESDQQKVERLNHYLASQTEVDDSNKALPYLEPSPYTLESITISRQDVEDVLQHLNISKALDLILSAPAFSKKEQMCFLYHTPLYSTVPSNRDTSQTLGKKPTVRLFLKRMKNLFLVTTDLYLFYAKLEKKWNDVSINIFTTI